MKDPLVFIIKISMNKNETGGVLDSINCLIEEVITALSYITTPFMFSEEKTSVLDILITFGPSTSATLSTAQKMN
jgi:hypothetical protein